MSGDPRTAVIDGRRFRNVSNSAGGDVSGDTTFHYRQEGTTVWADYAGGQIIRGFLVGTRDGDHLEFRYVHLDRSKRTASGKCSSRIEILADGRIQLQETWSWESHDGQGESVVVEEVG